MAIRWCVAAMAILLLPGCGGAPASQSGPAGPAPPSKCPASSAAAPDERGRATFLVQTGHAAPINRLALSHDGRILASAALDSTLRIWDVRSGLLLARLRAPGAAHTLALSADGDVVVYAGEAVRPKTIVVRRLSTGETKTIAQYGPFALTPDGKTLAVGAAGVALYETAGATHERTIPISPMAGEVEGIAIDAGGATVGVGFGATVDKGEIALVDVAAGKVVRRLPQPGGGDLSRTAHDLAFGDGTLAFLQGRGMVHLLAIEGNAPPKQIPGTWSGIGVAGGKLWRLERGDHDEKSRLSGMDLRSGAELGSLEQPNQRERMAVSGDGRTGVLSWHDPLGGDTIEVIDLGRMRVVRTLEGRQTGVHAIAVDPGGAQVAVGSQGALSHWTMPDGEMRLWSRDRDIAGVGALAFDASGAQLASIDRGSGVVVRETKTGRVVRRWRASDLDEAWWLAFRPSSELVVVQRGRVSAGGSIDAWDLSGPLPAAPAKEPAGRRDLAAPRRREIAKLGWQVESAALSPDGTRLAASGRPLMKLEELHVAVVDLASGAMVWDQQRRAWGGVLMSAVGFSPSGKEVLLSSFEPQALDVDVQAPAALRALDGSTGAVLRESRPGTQGPVAARGTVIAIAGEEPVLVDAAKLGVVSRLEGIDRPSRAVAPHPKLDAFLFGDDSGATTMVSSTGEVLALLVSTSRGDWVAATPSGAFRASLDGARSVAWSFAPPLEGFSFEQFAASFERPDLVRTWLEGKKAASPMPIARPPRLRLDPGAHAAEVTGASMSVAASVASGGLVERVRAFVNGRPAAEAMVCKASADVKLDVPLPGGRSKVALIAYDSSGLASNAAMLDVVSKRAADRPALWAVTVGVSRYDRLGPEHQLEAADDDARAVAAALRGLAGPGRPFTRANVITLLDAEAKPASIERAIAALSGMRPDDLGVVFLAGHGVRLSDGKMVFLGSGATFGEESARREGVGWDAVEVALAKTPGRVLMLLDACHAGHVSTERIAQNESLAKALSAEGRAGVLVFAASRGAQVSYEVSDGGGGTRGLELAWSGERPRAGKPLATGHGLFTAAILEALAGEAPDRDRSGAVEASELVDYVTERVRAASNGKQTPWVARREMFGDFAVAPAGR